MVFSGASLAVHSPEIADGKLQHEKAEKAGVQLLLPAFFSIKKRLDENQGQGSQADLEIVRVIVPAAMEAPKREASIQASPKS